MFDNIYVLSKHGYNIYFGPPSQLVTHLNSFGLYCPNFHNPSDFIIEIASGGYGDAKMQKALEMRRSRVVVTTGDQPSLKGFKSNKPKIRKNGFSPRDFLLVFKRNFKVVIREPLLTSMRLIIHLSVGLVVG